METKQKNKIDAQIKTSWKRRIFSAITIFIPIIFIVGLEFSLRWFDYGTDVSLFRRQEIYGKSYYTINPDVKYRYFGSMPFSPSTSIQNFLVQKPEGFYRIFCLGGSTTIGYPYYINAAFPSFLSERLKALFPKKNIEVINLGMTATNSYTTLDFAQDLMECQPDLIIAYDGHNEFYGALGVASNQTSGSFRFLARLRIRLTHLQTFQLLQNAIYKITSLFKHSDTSKSSATVMEIMSYGQYIPYENNIYNTTYSIFRDNLNDLRDLCQSKGVPLILGTQVSNFRDQPPFISENSKDLSVQQRTSFLKIYKTGLEFQTKGLLDSAISYFHSAIAIDSLYACAHYHLAQSLASSHDKYEALHQYILARNYDELRFRTDSKFNYLIKSMDDNKNCFVNDAEEYFKSISQDSLIGQNLITEHLHPNIWGNFVLSKSYAQVMRNHGLLATQQEWISADTLNEKRLWKNRSTTDLDELLGKHAVKFVTSGWPFKAQAPIAEYVSPKDTLNRIAQLLARGKMGWMDARLEAIEFYTQRKEWTRVEQEYIILIDIYPHLINLYMQLAKIYFDNQRLDDMKTILLRSLEVYPTLLAYRSIGNIMMDKGDPASAVKYFEKMDGFFQYPGEKIQNEFFMSFAYAKAGELQKAKVRLLNLLKDKPDFEQAVQLLSYVNKQIEIEQKLKN